MKSVKVPRVIGVWLTEQRVGDKRGGLEEVRVVDGEIKDGIDEL